jgi:signal transduction histidine kinase
MSVILVDRRCGLSMLFPRFEAAPFDIKILIQLLTIMYQILDFSKIESGRLDVEEVPFSLGMVLRDVSKMLSFAAERKGIEFRSDFQICEKDNLILLGDPGRVRQM